MKSKNFKTFNQLQLEKLKKKKSKNHYHKRYKFGIINRYSTKNFKNAKLLKLGCNIVDSESFLSKTTTAPTNKKTEVIKATTETVATSAATVSAATATVATATPTVATATTTVSTATATVSTA